MTEEDKPYAAYMELMSRCALDSDLSEVHGMFCGILGSHARDAEALWQRELFDQEEEGDLLEQECREELQRLFDATHEAITGPGLGFTPMLPDDDAPLAERTAALTSWVAGFLYGLGLGGLSTEALGDDAREVLQDLSDFGRVEEKVVENEENEEAYAELVEYLWVAVMLVYAEVEERA